MASSQQHSDAIRKLVEGASKLPAARTQIKLKVGQPKPKGPTKPKIRSETALGADEE